MLKTIVVFMIIVGLGGQRDWLWNEEVGGPRPVPVVAPIIAQPPQTTPEATRTGYGFLYPNSCVADALARAAGINSAVLHARIDELYRAGMLVNVDAMRATVPDHYPFELGPITFENVILVLNAMGYTVIKTEASPEVLATIRGWSVMSYGWHAYSVAGYNAATGILSTIKPTMSFRVSELGVWKRQGTPTEPLPDVWVYPDLYIVR